MTTPPPSAPLTDAELDAQLAAAEASQRRRRLLTLGLPPVVLLVLLVLPWVLGYGPFCHTLWRNAPIELHVLNLSGEDVVLRVPGNSAASIPSGTLQSIDTTAGSFTIHTTRATDGTVVEDVPLTTDRDALYVVGGGECLAVFDVTSYYGGRGGGLVIVHRITEQDRVWAFTGDTTLLPRRTAPDQARGTVHWIEPVDCNSLAVENEEDLVIWAEYRLRQRRERLEEQRQQLRQQQGR